MADDLMDFIKSKSVNASNNGLNLVQKTIRTPIRPTRAQQDQATRNFYKVQKAVKPIMDFKMAEEKRVKEAKAKEMSDRAAINRKNIINKKLGLPLEVYVADGLTPAERINQFAKDKAVIDMVGGAKLPKSIKPYKPTASESAITQKIQASQKQAKQTAIDNASDFYKITEHLNNMQSDKNYAKEYNQQIKMEKAMETVKKNESTPMGKSTNEILSFAGNYVNSLLGGGLVSNLTQTSQSGMTKELASIPDIRQTLDALSYNSPISAGLGNVAGQITNMVVMTNMQNQLLSQGFKLAEISSASRIARDLNYIGIGVATQLPQSVFKRDAVQQLIKERGEVGTEIALSALSWYAGGKLEQLFDGAIGRSLLNANQMLEARQTFLTLARQKQFLKAVSGTVGKGLTKVPPLAKIITEFAQSSGMALTDQLTGRQDYMNNPALLAQEFAVDFISLMILGKMGMDGTNKAAARSDLFKAKKNYLREVSGENRTENEISVAKTNLMVDIDNIVQKYGISEAEIKPMQAIFKDILTKTPEQIYSEVGSPTEAKAEMDMEEQTARVLADDQNKELSPKRSSTDNEVDSTTLFNDAVRNGAVPGLTAEDVANAEFKSEPVNQDAMDMATNMKAMFGVDIQFGNFGDTNIDSRWNGFYNPDTNVITINTKSDKAVSAVVMHEITHAMEQNNPKAYAELQDMVLKYTADNNIELADMTKAYSDNPDVDTKGSDIANSEYTADMLLRLTENGNIGLKFWDDALKNGKKNVVMRFVSDMKRAYAVLKSKSYKQKSVENGIVGLYKIIRQADTALAKFKGEDKAFVKAETKVEEVKPKQEVKQESVTAKTETKLKERGTDAAWETLDKNVKSAIATDVEKESPQQLAYTVGSLKEEISLIKNGYQSKYKENLLQKIVDKMDKKVDEYYSKRQELMKETENPLELLTTEPITKEVTTPIKEKAVATKPTPKKAIKKGELVAKDNTNKIANKKYTSWEDVAGKQDIPQGKTYDEYQQMIDDYEDVLAAKYGEEELMNIPSMYFKNNSLEENRGNTKATNSEIAKYSALLDARDKVSSDEKNAMADSIIKRINPIESMWTPSKDEIKDTLSDMMNNAELRMVFGNNNAETSKEQIENELYNDFKWNNDFPQEYFDTYKDVLDEYNLQKSKGLSNFGDLIPFIDTIKQISDVITNENADYSKKPDYKEVKEPKKTPIQRVITDTPKELRDKIKIAEETYQKAYAKEFETYPRDKEISNAVLKSKRELDSLKRDYKILQFQKPELFKKPTKQPATKSTDTPTTKSIKKVDNVPVEEVKAVKQEAKKPVKVEEPIKESDLPIGFNKYEKEPTGTAKMATASKADSFSTYIDTDSYIGNGHYVLLKSEMDTKVSDKFTKSKTPNKNITENNIIDMLSPKQIPESESQVVASKDDGDFNVVILKGEDDYVAMQKTYYDYFKSKGYELRASTPVGAIYMLKKGKMIGMVLPTRTDTETLKYYIKYGKMPVESKTNKPLQFSLVGKKISKGFGTELATKLGSEEYKKELLDAEEKFAYEVVGSKQLLKDKATELATGNVADNVTKYRADWNNLIKEGRKIKPDDWAKAIALLNHYKVVDTPETRAEAIDLRASIAVELGDSARFMQAISMLEKAGKDVYLKHLEKTLEKYYQSGLKKYGEKFWNEKGNMRDVSRLTADEQKAILATKEDDIVARDRIKMQIASRILSEAPYSLMDQLNSFRKFAMLTSPRTHIRNITSNASYMAIRRLDNAFSTIIQNAFVKNDKAMVRSITGDKAKQKIVEDYMKANKKAIQSGVESDFYGTNKLLGVTRTDLNPSWKIFKPLNAYMQANGKMLAEWEDTPFFNNAYKFALVRYLKMQKLNEVTADAHLYGLQQALDATFKATDKILKGYMNFKNSSVVGNYLADTVVPFTKTPYNVVKQSILHSPMGFVSGLVNLSKYLNGTNLTQLQSGKIVKRGDVETLQKAIDDIGKATSGSLLAGIGIALFNLGILTGPPEDEYQRKQFIASVGQAPFAFHFGDKYYPIAFMQPAMTALTVGASMAKGLQGKGITADGVLSSFGDGSETLFDLPMLQGVQRLFDTTGNKTMTDKALEVAMSNVKQFIPNILGDFAAARTPEKHTSYTPPINKEGVPPAIYKAMSEMVNKVWPERYPVATNIWGEPVKRAETDFGRIVQSFFSPVIISKDKMDSVSSEVSRLSKAITTNTKMLPSSAPQYLEVDGEKIYLDAKQYPKWNVVNGQESYKGLQKLFANPDYAKLSDEAKLKAIEDVYQYATEKANNEVLVANGKSAIEYNSAIENVNKAYRDIYVSQLKSDIKAKQTSIPYKTSDTTITINKRKFEMTPEQQNELDKIINSEISSYLAKTISSPTFKLKSADTRKKLLDTYKDKIIEREKKRYVSKYLLNK